MKKHIPPEVENNKRIRLTLQPVRKCQFPANGTIIDIRIKTVHIKC